jgi:hypothetical protein
VSIELDAPMQTPTNSVAETSNAYKATFFIIFYPPIG